MASWNNNIGTERLANGEYSVRWPLWRLFLCVDKVGVTKPLCVTTAWRVFRQPMEDTAYGYGGRLRVDRIKSRGWPAKGGPPVWGLGEGLTYPHC